MRAILATKRKHRAVYMIGFMLLVWIVFSFMIVPDISACSVADYRPPTIDERVNDATHIALVTDGYFTDTEVEAFQYPDANLKVVEWLKGDDLETEIAVSGFGSGGGDCRAPVPVEATIVFLKKDSSGAYRLNYLGVYDATILATPENKSAVNDALNGYSFMDSVGPAAIVVGIILLALYFYVGRKLFLKREK